VITVEAQFHSLLTWALDGGKWQALGSCRLCHREIAPVPKKQTGR